MKRILFILTMGLTVSAPVSAQKYAVKTNALLWTTTSVNAAFEAGLAKQTTLELGVSWNPWTFKDNKQIRHWLFQPEFRYWTCERFNRGFFGLHLLSGEMNAGRMKLPFDLYPSLRDYRYQGWFTGAGVSYGYNWRLAPHWNIEATAGAGYVHARYTRYLCPGCGEKVNTGKKNYFGPTKLGLNISYLF